MNKEKIVSVLKAIGLFLWESIRFIAFICVYLVVYTICSGLFFDKMYDKANGNDTIIFISLGVWLVAWITSYILFMVIVGKVRDLYRSVMDLTGRTKDVINNHSRILLDHENKLYSDKN